MTNKERLSTTIARLDELLAEGGVDRLLKESYGTSFIEWAMQMTSFVGGKEAESVGAALQLVACVRHDRWVGTDGFRNKLTAKLIELSYPLIRGEFLARAQAAVTEMHNDGDR